VYKVLRDLISSPVATVFAPLRLGLCATVPKHNSMTPRAGMTGMRGPSCCIE
jgi:hypothetical protein